jgi:hypothetical protein
MAQKSTISVSGHVYEQSSAVLPGATVRLEQPCSGFIREVKTGADGSFRSLTDRQLRIKRLGGGVQGNENDAELSSQSDLQGRFKTFGVERGLVTLSA